MYAQIEQLETELQTKQTQLNFLMRITQAINENMTAADLFDMYSQFLQKELGVERLAMLFKEGDRWICRKALNFKPVNLSYMANLLVSKYKDFSSVGELSDDILKPFDHIIPVFHKDDPIAYVLVGALDRTEDQYDRIKFMISITNVVTVAIENKRLFNRHIEQETYKKELEVAQQVQQMLIPSVLPDDEDVEISAVYRPHSNIGGDYFDYQKLDDGQIVLCLADVSGKGIPAALLMANFQATLRSALLIYDRLDDLVHYINKTLVDLTKSERIVTFFILRYDPLSQKVRYVNAGHNPAIFIQGEKSQFLAKGCTILGAVEHLDMIEVGEIDIGAEETMIVIYTDGLTDLMDGNGKYFDEHLIRDFASKHRDESATNFNNMLLNRMERFKGTQAYPDDIAVLTFKIKSKPFQQNKMDEK